jgi:hypothetical protein
MPKKIQKKSARFANTGAIPRASTHNEMLAGPLARYRHLPRPFPAH